MSDGAPVDAEVAAAADRALRAVLPRLARDLLDGAPEDVVVVLVTPASSLYAAARLGTGAETLDHGDVMLVWTRAAARATFARNGWVAVARGIAAGVPGRLDVVVMAAGDTARRARVALGVAGAPDAG